MHTLDIGYCPHDIIIMTVYTNTIPCSRATPPTSSRRLATRLTTPLTKHAYILYKRLTTFYSRAKPPAWNSPIRTLSRKRVGCCTIRVPDQIVSVSFESTVSRGSVFLIPAVLVVTLLLGAEFVFVLLSREWFMRCCFF